MKTTVLKRKALVLSMAMAFIGAMTLTQCKKEPPIVTSTEDPTETPTDTVTTPEGEIVHITLRVNQSNDEKLDVDPPHVYFETGDKIHVVSNGVHVGVVTYTGSEFAGNISGATSGMPLDFYLLGNMDVNNSNITWTPEAGDVKTGCFFNISTQSSTLPVVSYAPSNETYTGSEGITDFTAILRNKCALVKFDVIPTTLTSNIILSGVKNVVTVNFNPDNENEEERFAYSQSEGGGSITVGSEDGYWAILLPQAAISGVENNVNSEVTPGIIYSATVSLPAIQANAYLNTGITVDFTKNGTVPLYSIGVSTNPNEGGSVSGSGDYLNGQSCTVTATPDEDYMFINWTENGTEVSTNATYTFTVNGNRNLVANFGLKRTISVSVNPTESGTVTGGGEYPQGQSCTVTATHAEGYVFDNWTENGTEVSTDATYTFTVDADRTLVANFSSSGNGHR